MFILDWIDDNFTIAGPIGAVVGLAVAVVIALVAQQIGYKMIFNKQSTSDIVGVVMIVIFTAFFFAAGFTDWFLI